MIKPLFYLFFPFCASNVILAWNVYHENQYEHTTTKKFTIIYMDSCSLDSGGLCWAISVNWFTFIQASTCTLYCIFSVFLSLFSSSWSPLKIILKQLFASGSVIIITLPSANNNNNNHIVLIAKQTSFYCKWKSIAPSFIIFLRIEEYLAKEKNKLNLHLVKQGNSYKHLVEIFGLN